MDRAKILDKIKKCLALSKSPNEHEAAAALRQAQKLMERHGITERDIGAIGYGFERVDTSIQRGKGRYNKRTGAFTAPKVPVTLAYIVNLMEDAFGVRPVYSTPIRETDPNWSVTYYGPEHRVVLAAYAHTVVARAVEAGWQTFLKDNVHFKKRAGGRAGYYVGWLGAVRKQIEEFGMTDEEKAATDLVVKSNTRALTKQATSNTGIYSAPKTAGAQDGESFKLHRPMSVDRKQLEKKS